MAKLFPDTVENARYATFYAGKREVPWLLVDLDGVTLAIHREQLFPKKYGIVVLTEPPEGPYDDASQQFKAILPEEPWRAAREYLGATADPRVLRLFQQYTFDLETDRFEPGKRLEVKSAE